MSPARSAPAPTPTPAPPAPPEPETPEPFAQRSALPEEGASFAPLELMSGAVVAQRSQELEPLLASGAEVDLERFFYVFYRSRDRATLPTHRRVAVSHPNFLQRLWSIALLGELGDHSDVPLLAGLAVDENPLVREVAANALGRVAKNGDLPRLDALLAAERDDYVRTTLEAARRRVVQRRPPQLTQPVFDPGTRRLTYFFNLGVEDGLHTERSAPASSFPPSTGFVFPHQQYRFGVPRSPPLPSFGGPRAHVGEDSGWFLQGLPVHAMAAGVVCRVLYDLSWGTVVVVGHELPSGERVTSYYAHLHHDVDVAAGDPVTMGQKLGEIGPAVSMENGGYWSHLHTGLERAECGSARVAGYDPRLERYADPLWWVLEHAARAP